MEYIAYLHKDSKSDFGVSFPDFPGCVSAGKTLEEARRMAEEALALHIEGLRTARQFRSHHDRRCGGRPCYEGCCGISSERRSREDCAGEHHRAGKPDQCH